MAQQNFVDDQSVDTISSEVLQKPSDEKLAQLEAKRDKSAGIGGSTTRAGVTTKDPKGE